MTPLWGTRHSSALAGDKSGGDGRAARSLLSCALWSGMGGYGAAWAAWGAPSRCPRTVRTGNRAFRVFTKHETRDTNHGFFSNHSYPAHDFPPFPTISRHFPAFPGISRPPPPPPPPIKCPRAVRLSWSAARDCRPRPVAAFLRVVARHGAAMARHGAAMARHGAAMARHGRPPSPAPATQPFGYLQPRIMKHGFPIPAATPRRATPSPANGFSRITKHETRLFFAMGAQGTHNQKPPPGQPRIPPGHCFPARCGAAWAAMARHGRPPSPAPATRPVGFLQPRDTQHGFSQSLPQLQGEQPQTRPTGFHESRDTNHETRLLCFPTHHFPRFPGISRYFSVGGGVLRNRCSSTVAGKSHKNAQTPASVGGCMGCTVSRGSRCPPGCLGCGQHKMNS